MAPVALFILAILAHLVVLHSAEYSAEEPAKHCPVHFCSSSAGDISFPFKGREDPPECGLFTVDCSDPKRPKIQLKEEGHWHEFEGSLLSTSIQIKDRDLASRLERERCNDQIFDDLSLPNASSIPDVELFTHNLTLFKCNIILDNKFYPQLSDSCENANHTYYIAPSNSSLPSPSPPAPPGCATIHVPRRPSQPNKFSSVTADFPLLVLTPDCYQCLEKKGECRVGQGKFICNTTEKEEKEGRGHKQLKLKHGLEIGLGFPALLAMCGFLLLLYKQKRSSLFLSRNISSQPYTNSDIEGGGAYCGVPVFSYRELDEATNHFDSEKELGDGGFGTVYHGKN